MSKNTTTNVKNNNSSELPAPPSRFLRLITEARWFIWIAITIFFVIALFTYSKADPGWSHAVTNTSIHNMGGRIGAWVSDILLFAFGISAWWCLLWLLKAILRGYRRISRLVRFLEEPKEHWFRDRFAPNFGFLVMILASSSIEFLRLYTLKAKLPRCPGGVLGELIGTEAHYYLGFTGSTLILLIIWALGFSLFLQMSWLQLAEGVGAFFEGIISLFVRSYRTRQDRKIGQEASIKREEVVQQKAKAVEEAIPVRIEPQVVEIPKSIRAEKEKQVVLFSELQELPPLSLLDDVSDKHEVITEDSLAFTSRLIEKTLADFGVSVRVVSASPGPVVIRYEIEPATGVKVSQIVNLERDLARALSMSAIRVIDTVEGTNYMAIEVPNPKRQIIRLTEILNSKVYNDQSSNLTIALGKDIAGKPKVADLAKMPHLLVAGTTGSGKSVAINATILSLLYKATPEQVRLILIDPKMLELSIYEGIPHLLAPVVTDMQQAGHALNWAVNEMERRYRLMAKIGVRNLAGFNSKIVEAKKKNEPLTNPFTITPDNPEPLEELPNIVIIIDELADLMMVVGKKVEEQIARIAQKARAAGIHLILATQRPSVDVITGLIKANVPSRIAFQVSSKTDSRTILDRNGAESLLGLGDMLYSPNSAVPARLHGAFVSDDEVHRVVDYLKEHGEPNYVDGILEPSVGDANGESGEADGESDELYDQAVAIVLKNKRASISLVQRHLRIGYNRAARLLEQMERSGVVSAMDSKNNREILVPTDQN